MIPTLGIILLGVGNYIVSKISPNSWFARWWRAYICDIDPDDK